MAGLSVVIPALNEAGSLPLLLGDLHSWPGSLQILICDGGSDDATAVAARLAGATVLSCPQPGRGQQLCFGMRHACHAWLLVLHADSRLSPQWTQAINKALREPRAEHQAWAFDFRVDERRPMLWMLEQLVALRSRWWQRPYGDQGLLIHRHLYERVGGYRPLTLMEDLDLVERLNRITRIRSLHCALITSARRWHRKGVLQQAWINARLRRRWRRGTPPAQLMEIYKR